MVSNCCQLNLLSNWSLNFFRSIDFIGRKPKLKLNQKPRNQTVIGGILCILMFALFIPSALYFGQELVYRVLPKIIESSIPLNESDSIKISKDSFSFYLYLRNSKGLLYSTDGYLDLSLEIINVTNPGNPYEVAYASTPIGIKECDENDFPNLSVMDQGIYLDYLHMFKCIKDNHNTIIQSTNHYQTFSFLQLKIRKCLQDSTKCKDSEEIDKQLRSSILVFKYLDTEYNHREFDNYSNLHIKEELFTLNNQFDKEIIVSLKKTEFYTDIGYIFEDFRLKSFHNIFTIKEKSLFSPKNDFYISMIFNLDYSKSVNYRKYYKFQNWVAELGGIVKAISLIASIINYFNDKSSYYELMINKLFDVDDVIKYYQYFDVGNVTTKRKRKRDSIVLLNAKKEKDYFEKEGLNRIVTDKNSFSNHLHCNTLKKSFKKITSSISKSDFEPVNLNNYCLTHTVNNTNPNTNTNANNNNKHTIINNEITNSNCNLIKDNSDNNNIIQQIPRSHNPQSIENGSDNNDPHETYISNLKKSKTTKDHFDKIKKDRFSLNMFEQIVFCFCQQKDNPKYNALFGGRELLKERSDIVYILRKNLEFDRLKNLILRDNQMLLLNSLTKFMLDPERVNLINFNQCNFDKFVDSYDDVISAPDMIDIKLSKWVETKFKFDQSK